MTQYYYTNPDGTHVDIQHNGAQNVVAVLMIIFIVFMYPFAELKRRIAK